MLVCSCFLVLLVQLPSSLVAFALDGRNHACVQLLPCLGSAPLKPCRFALLAKTMLVCSCFPVLLVQLHLKHRGFVFGGRNLAGVQSVSCLAGPMFAGRHNQHCKGKAKEARAEHTGKPNRQHDQNQPHFVAIIVLPWRTCTCSAERAAHPQIDCP